MFSLTESIKLLFVVLSLVTPIGCSDLGSQTLIMSASEERKLGVLDYVNSVIGGLTIDLQGRGECDSLSIGSVIFSTSEITNDGERQKKTATLRAQNIRAECGFRFKPPLLPTITLPFESIGSAVTLRAEFFSPDFSRVVPNEASLPSDFSCGGSTFDLELSIFDAGIPGVSDAVTAALNAIVGNVVNNFCAEITTGLTNLLLLVGENPFLDIIGERLDSPANLEDILADEEALILSKVPDGFEFLDPSRFDALMSHLVEQVINSDLGQTVIPPALERNYEPALDALLLILDDFDVELDPEFLTLANVIATNKDFNELINGIVSGETSLAEVLGRFSLPVPSAEELLGVFPDEILSFLETIGLLGRIKNILDFFLPADSVNEVNFGLTVGFLIDTFPPTAFNTLLLERFGTETRVFDALSILFGELTFGELAEVLPFGFGDLFFEVFGEDAVAFDVLVNFPARLADFLNSLFGDFQLVSTDPIPDILVPILEITTSFRPDLEQFEFVTGETTLGEFLALFPLSFDAGLFGLGVISLTFTSFETAIEFEISDFDFAEDFSSIILPKFQIKTGSSANVELLLEIRSNGIVDYTDTVTLISSFDFETQEAVVPAASYSSLFDFDFISLASGPALTSFGQDFATCGQASVGFGFSSQRTVANFASFVVLELETDPFIEDTINEVLGLYAPALPTFLENFIINFFTENQGNLFLLDDDASVSCSRDFVAIVRPPTIAPEEPETTLAASLGESSGLDLNLIMFTVGLVGFFLLASVGYFIVVADGIERIKQARNARSAKALLAVEDNLRPVRPKAAVVASAKSSIPVKAPTRPSRPAARSVKAAKTVLPIITRLSVPGSFQEVTMPEEEIDF